ncbi:MAG: alkaline phosphatase [Bacteroidales bacterium]|nr:alkaline phosphatase [Candidatus Latescibacterota bacterium]
MDGRSYTIILPEEMDQMKESMQESNRSLKVRFMIAVMLLMTLVILPHGEAQSGEREKPENIILFIGDGMGISHITAARTILGSLNIERMKVVGLQSTIPFGGYITDSAASGTAIATGEKTYNGAISVDSEGSPLKTVMEYAEDEGWSTGLVVTCAITHATPAVFISHVKSRSLYEDIAWQIADSGVDLIFGGGLAWFLPSSDPESKRTDEYDPLNILAARMNVVVSSEEILQLPDSGSVAAFISLEHPECLPVRDISLSEMTRKAINILSADGRNFFLMVEGSQIDWAAHDHDFSSMMLEMKDFDEAVGVALDYSRADGETLVIVTADHETGGFAVHDGSVADSTVTEWGWTTGSHTASMVPLFADGPLAEDFSGIYENTRIGKLLIGLVRSDKSAHE